MATIINNPRPNNNGMGFLLGVIALIIIVLLLFYYGLPMLRSVGTGNPTINVPSKVDVNVHTPDTQK